MTAVKRVVQSLDRIGNQRGTYQDAQPVANCIPDKVRTKIVDLALAESELSPLELAVRFTDTEKYFVSESSVYRTLKEHDLITSPAYVVLKAADEFEDKTTAPNQFWQTDFTYPKVIGWGGLGNHFLAFLGMGLSP